MPVRCLLERPARAHQQVFAEVGGHELEGHGRALGSASSGQRDRGAARQVEGAGIAQHAREQLGIGAEMRHALQRGGRKGRGGDQQQVHLREECTHPAREVRAAQQQPLVVGGGQAQPQVDQPGEPGAIDLAPCRESGAVRHGGLHRAQRRPVLHRLGGIGKADLLHAGPQALRHRQGLLHRLAGGGIHAVQCPLPVHAQAQAGESARHHGQIVGHAALAGRRVQRVRPGDGREHGCGIGSTARHRAYVVQGRGQFEGAVAAHPAPGGLEPRDAVGGRWKADGAPGVRAQRSEAQPRRRGHARAAGRGPGP